MKSTVSHRPRMQRSSVKWKLVMYDALLFLFASYLIIGIYPSEEYRIPTKYMLMQIGLSMTCVLGARLVLRSYHQIWRYARTSCYLHLIMCDVVGGIVFYVVQRWLPIWELTFLRTVCHISFNLLLAILVRFVYQYIYEFPAGRLTQGRFTQKLVQLLTGLNMEQEIETQRIQKRKINIAIVGAGRVGVMLAEELLNNPGASYVPKCFIDEDQSKVGRYIHNIQVLSREQATPDLLTEYAVQEIVFAIPGADAEKKMGLYEQYKKTGCRLKTYDFPVTQSVAAPGKNSKRQMRSFDPEELLFREVRDFTNQKTRDYYRGKTILISGGGGSIGSELSRQIAKMEPKQLIILDIYENCAYDIQQELKIAYEDSLNLAIEIVSVCDRAQLEMVFRKYRPDLVLHAAAHKHVPLMEHNCSEAVKNNVFGTLNMVELSEAYNVEKFIMISTDKAVNPTNVMGATKRMCEMIVQSRKGKTIFSATRFGNVLGSNGSVIPLFRRQILAGGPVTLTDRRIIRYFMTIPEASQLVLASGAMAKSGELFALDMGKPVKILDLAENMIRLSGYEPYKDIDIVETGLRPGEKLYEELLIKSEEHYKTDNSMIFVERDQPLTPEQIAEKLDILWKAVETENDENVRDALKAVVPTFHTPEKVNAAAADAEEMNNIRKVPVAVAN